MQFADVALTYALRKAHLAAATASPAGAASLYEGVKRTTYQHLINSSTSDLVPLV